MPEANEKKAKKPVALGVLLAVLGVVLLLGGITLMSKGASPYFAVVGVGLASTGVLLALGKKAGLAVYGLTFAFILVGSFVEEGLNPAALTPRLLIPFVILLYLSQERVRSTLA